MSLRRRLLWSLGSAFVLLWITVAGLMYLHLQRQVSQTLDQRLAASANMVAGLIARHPEMLVPVPRSPLFVTPESEGVACQIRAASGEVLLQTRGLPELLAGNISPGYTSRRIGDQLWRLYTLDQNGIRVTTADRMAEREALTRGIILVMVVPFALALFGGLLTLWWGIRSGLRPLQALHDQLRQRTPENLEPVRVPQAPTELSPVIATLNRLLRRVARTVVWEQRFASHVAHEFRTPLTGVKTHLEVARRVTGERRQQALEQAAEGVVRLQKVTEQLLVLARPEQYGVAQDPAGCRLEECVQTLLAELPQADRVVLDNHCCGCRVAMPAELVTVAIRNLVDNALKYSDVTCQVVIERDPEQPEMVRILVRDGGCSGAGETPLQPLPPGPQSHGLGLAIVDMIVNQYRGTLKSADNPAGGMDWLLRLPLADAD